MLSKAVITAFPSVSLPFLAVPLCTIGWRCATLRCSAESDRCAQKRCRRAAIGMPSLQPPMGGWPGPPALALPRGVFRVPRPTPPTSPRCPTPASRPAPFMRAATIDLGTNSNLDKLAQLDKEELMGLRMKQLKQARWWPREESVPGTGGADSGWEGYAVGDGQRSVYLNSAD